jgi:hypothetical protein
MFWLWFRTRSYTFPARVRWFTDSWVPNLWLRYRISTQEYLSEHLFGATVVHCLDKATER